MDLEDEDQHLVEAQGHVARATMLCRWTAGALVLLAAGALAYFVGTLMFGSGTGLPGGLAWSQDLLAAGFLLAVLAIGAVGLLVLRPFLPIGRPSSDQS